MFIGQNISCSQPQFEKVVGWHTEVGPFVFDRSPRVDAPCDLLEQVLNENVLVKS
jgi:hypothetical protein